MARFLATRYRRIPVLYGIVSDYVRHDNHYINEIRRSKIDDLESVGFPARFLATLRTVADRHDASIANVAVRYVLDRPAVAGAIVGARLGVAEHTSDNASVFRIQLGAEDMKAIEAVLAQSRDLYHLIGDCGDEYRRYQR